MIALGLAVRVPESVDGVALEPNKQDLGDIANDIDDCDGKETAADLGVYQVPLVFELGENVERTYCLARSFQLKMPLQPLCQWGWPG